MVGLGHEYNADPDLEDVLGDRNRSDYVDSTLVRELNRSGFRVDPAKGTKLPRVRQDIVTEDDLQTTLATIELDLLEPDLDEKGRRNLLKRKKEVERELSHVQAITYLTRTKRSERK